MVRAVHKAKAVFDCFDTQHNSLTLDEFSELTGMPKATTSRVVKTIEGCGFLVRVEGQYRLSPKFVRLAGLVQRNLGIVDLAKPILTQVARKARETVTLNTLSNDVRIIADVVQIQAPLMTVAKEGQQVSLLYGAIGRTLLAYMDTAARARILHALPKAERAVVERELSRFRAQGYSLSSGQRVKGLSSVAVPIFDGQQRVNHCLAVTGPSIRLEGREQELIDLMLAAGHELSQKLIDLESAAPPGPYRGESFAPRAARASDAVSREEKRRGEKKKKIARKPLRRRRPG